MYFDLKTKEERVTQSEKVTKSGLKILYEMCVKYETL